MIMAHLGCDYIFVKRELTKWLFEVEQIIDGLPINIMDLVYWEQRMGNWGILTRNEQDVANDGFMPFNNRELQMIILNNKMELREWPDYIMHKDIIKYLWPEILKTPINPNSVKIRIVLFFRSKLPRGLKNRLKKTLIHKL